MVPKQRPENTDPGAPKGGRVRPDPAEHARTSFIAGMGSVGEFWGIAPAMGSSTVLVVSASILSRS